MPGRLKDASEQTATTPAFPTGSAGTGKPLPIRAFDQAAIGMALVGIDGNWIRVNSALSQLVGYSNKELLGTNFQSITHPDDLTTDLHYVERMLKGEIRSYQMEKRYFHKLGDILWVLLSVSLISDKQGKPLFFFSQVQNITERKCSEEALRRLVAVVDASHDAIISETLEGNIVSWNSGAERIFGYSAAEVIGHSITILSPPELPREAVDLLADAYLGKHIDQFETVRVRKDGRQINVALTLSPIKDAKGEIIALSAIARDTTESKRMENMFRQAQKMEAVGRLAGGVAHDFNNLLGVIIGYSELMLEQLNQDDPLHRQTEQIKKAGDRAAALTRQLLAFSRQQPLEARVLNLDSIVADLQKMLPRLIGEDIDLKISLHAPLEKVRADKGQIEQVILNLAVNARDAMPDGGKLLIKTKKVEVDEVYALQHPPMIAGRYVLLEMIDSGIGMDAQTQARIFEPFYTTKEQGKGTGLGLATVYGVVKQSFGYIWVESVPGAGSVFSVYLPEVDVPVQRIPSGTGDLTSLRGSETVLLVEDEESLRTLTRILLEESGYTVLEAEDGDKAVEIARQYPAPIHVLLTDVVMPGRNGPSVVNFLAPTRPEMRVIYMSGYAGFPGRDSLGSDAMLLPKPFTRDALLRKIQEAMAPEVTSPAI